MDPGFTLQDTILDAIERAGGEASNAAMVRSAYRSCRIILEKWSAAGLNTWRVADITLRLPIEAGGTVLPPTLDDILEIQIVRASGASDSTIERIDLDRYAALPNKSQTGRPSQFWLDRKEQPILYLWPLGTAGLSARTWYLERPEGVSRRIPDLDMPARWLPALVTELGYELALKRPIGSVPPERIELLRSDAAAAFDLCRRNDRQRVSFFHGIARR